MSASRGIVFASEFWFGAVPDGIAHGLRQLGWDVGQVDIRDHFPTSRRLTLRILARLGYRESVRAYNAAIVEAVEAHAPRAFLTVKGLYLTPETLSKIRRLGVATINYYPDFHFDHSGLDQDTFEYYDRFITTKSFQLPYLREKLGEERVEFVHHGYSTLVHRPRVADIGERDYTSDVLYVGNYSPSKARWMELVARALPHVQLTIVGSGWVAPTRNTPLAEKVVGRVTIGDSYSRVIQSARINVALNMGRGGRHGWEDFVSMRAFEIPACKGFMLHIDNDEVRTLYEPGVEIDVFATPEALCERIEHYLARPKLRRKMIDRAYARAVPAYSYDERAKQIAGAVERACQANEKTELLSACRRPHTESISDISNPFVRT